MRIAISGTHRVGKTTLAEALANHLPGYELVPEPYHLLEDEGYDFEDMPSVEDFARQLERSIQSLEESGANVVFDRCPLDVLGYLVTHRDADAVDVDAWLPRVRAAMTTLDLIVFVPIEAPDRMPVARDEARFRSRVDEALHEIVIDDCYDVARPAVTVGGAVEARLRQVLGSVTRGAS